MNSEVVNELRNHLHFLIGELKTTKKSVIENAIQQYAEKIEKEGKIDLLEMTLGAWNRDKTADENVCPCHAAIGPSSSSRKPRYDSKEWLFIRTKGKGVPYAGTRKYIGIPILNQGQSH